MPSPRGAARSVGPDGPAELVARLSGLSPAMALAEWEALLAVAGGTPLPTGCPWLAAGRVPDAGRARTVLERLAFASGVAWGLSPPEGVPLDGLELDEERLRVQLRGWAPAAGSIAVRFEGLPFEGKRSRGGNALETRIGAAAGRMLPVRLQAPDVLLAGHVWNGRAWLGLRWLDIDTGGFEARTAQNRPYFSPVSLHPRIARCVVNLTRVPARGRLVDPFCGTGGLLLEAGLMGLRASGSDVDPRMVEGTRATLAHWDLSAEKLAVCDIAQATRELGTGYDGVACDLPYGRSASTRKEGAAPLRERALPLLAELVRPGGRIVAGTSEPVRPPPGLGLVEEAVHPLRVHRSLTRHFHVWRKEGS